MSVSSDTDVTTRVRPMESWSLVAAGTVLIGGVFFDGRAHSTALDDIESFLAPAHGVIFLGFVLAVAVVTRAVLARLDGGPWLHAVPDGWRTAVVGSAVFAIGFLADGAWHTVFGIEADLEALLSPTHLLMLSGALGILLAPISSQWRAVGSDGSWRTLGPAIAATTLIAGSVSFFLMWIWPVNTGVTLGSFADFAAAQPPDAAETLVGLGQSHGIAGYLLFGIVLAAPVLLLGRRWSLPPGAIVVVSVVPWIGMLSAFDVVFA